MTLIISKDGLGAQRIPQSGFDKEDYLQQYIHNNPDAIPVYEIDEDIRLLVLAREFSTNSGPIDALGVDQNGNIYLIETKLYKNPDKRTVVAQVLDYGAALWSSSIDFSDFTMQLEKHVQKHFHKSLTDEIQNFFSIDEDSTALLLENVQRNLNSGVFKFVVLMDSLQRRLKDLILFMNRNSQFDIYAVELEYYKHEAYEIIIPKMFGAQVKKDVVSARTSSGGVRKKWNQDMYWEEISAKLEPKNAVALRKVYDWAVDNADEINWGTGVTRGSFSPQFKSISPRSFISVFTDGSIQVSYAYMTESPDQQVRLRDTLAKHINVPGVTDLPDDVLKSTWKSISPDYVAENTNSLITALQEFIEG